MHKTPKLLLALLIAFSLAACSTEKERDQNNDLQDTEQQEDTDISNTDVEQDVEKDTEQQDTEEDIKENVEKDTEEDVEQDTEETDVPDIIVSRDPCTISEADNQISVECPDGTRATFIAPPSNETDEYCARVTNEDGLDTIQCETEYIIDDVLSGPGLITIKSPLGFAYLAHITAIKSNLTIKAPGLTSFDLPSLQEAQQSISVVDNASLKSLSFPELTTVTKAIYIEDNPVLTNLNHFNNLDVIGGSLDIKNNPLLSNMQGFDSLTHIGGNAEIMTNNGLTNFVGFEKLKKVGGYLRIEGHQKLENLNGLDTLNSVGATFPSAMPIKILANPELCNDIIDTWLEAYRERAGIDTAADIGLNKDCPKP